MWSWKGPSGNGEGDWRAFLNDAYASGVQGKCEEERDMEEIFIHDKQIATKNSSKVAS